MPASTAGGPGAILGRYDSAGVFFCWLRSPAFVRALDPGGSNGVPHISHRDIENIVFVPPPLADQRRTVRKVMALEAEADALHGFQGDTAAELDALLLAILDRAFRDEP